MAKNQAQSQAAGALATAAAGALTVVGVPQELRGGAMVEGLGEAQSLIGRLAMYNGTTQEQEMYDGCGFSPGDYFDVLERRKLVDPHIVPLGGYVSWMKWPKGAPTPEYNVREKSRVPQEDLVWKDSQPPVATECINMLVAVNGEPWPYLFIFKRTSYKAGQNMLRLEARRSAIGSGRGMYKLSSKKEKNSAGQTYHEVTVTPAGNCPESLYPLISAYLGNKSSMEQRAEKLATDTGAVEVVDGGDDIPI